MQILTWFVSICFNFQCGHLLEPNKKPRVRRINIKLPCDSNCFYCTTDKRGGQGLYHNAAGFCQGIVIFDSVYEYELLSKIPMQGTGIGSTNGSVWWPVHHRTARLIRGLALHSWNLISPYAVKLKLRVYVLCVIVNWWFHFLKLETGVILITEDATLNYDMKRSILKIPI